MLTSVSVAGQFFSSDDIIDRHNYGYMLYKKKEVQFMTAEVKMVFHYKLPNRVKLNPDRMNCSTVQTQRQNRCRVLSMLIHAFQALRASAHVHLQHQLDDIYDVVQEFPQSQKRAVCSDILSDNWTCDIGGSESSQLCSTTGRKRGSKSGRYLVNRNFTFCRSLSCNAA